MKLALLIAAAAFIASPATAQNAPALATLDPSAIQVTLPADLKWEGSGGSQFVKLYGDPDKPGPYGVIYKWAPGFNSLPHTHGTDRFAYIISGTWWMSTSRTPDKSTLVPIPQGSFVVHKAGEEHWDGGVDNTAIILITGVGPVETKRVAP